MSRLSTGFVRANGYANKVRKVLFALTRGKVVPENVVGLCSAKPVLV